MTTAATAPVTTVSYGLLSDPGGFLLAALNGFWNFNLVHLVVIATLIGVGLLLGRLKSKFVTMGIPIGVGLMAAGWVGKLFFSVFDPTLITVVIGLALCAAAFMAALGATAFIVGGGIALCLHAVRGVFNVLRHRWPARERMIRFAEVGFVAGLGAIGAIGLISEAFSSVGFARAVPEHIQLVVGGALGAKAWFSYRNFTDGVDVPDMDIGDTLG